MTSGKSAAMPALAYETGGGKATAAAPLLLIHGVGLNRACWMFQIEALSFSRHVFTVDLPGHGDSLFWTHSEPVGLADYTAALAHFCIGKIGRPAIVIGHSLGALIALDLAGRYPHLCAGVLPLSAIYRRSAEAKRAVKSRARRLNRLAVRENDVNSDGVTHDDVIMAPLSRWFDNPPHPREAPLAALCRRWLAATNRRGYAAAYDVFAREDGPDDALLKALRIPSLFVTGEDDRNSTPVMSQMMATLTPNSGAGVIKGARHMPQLTHAHEVTTMIEAFACRIAQ